VAAGAAAIVTAANASQGAYFSQSWGWVALAFLVPVAVALIVGVVEAPGSVRASFAVLVAALGVWIVLSATWSVSSAASIREGERMLVYVAVAFALALLLRRGDAAGLAGGVFAGTVAIAGYGLATRLFPERFDAYDDPDLPYRLSEPIGYWNSFGLLAAMGVLLGLGIAAHARRIRNRVVAGLALPVLATALYFAFSRGAWAALVLGYAAAVLLDPRRVRLLWTTVVLAPAAAGIVFVASRQDALTNEDAPVAEAVAQGERLALWLGGAVLLSGALAALGALVAGRVLPSARVRRGLDVALALVAVAAVVVGVASRGGPAEALSDLKERFDAPLVTRTPGSLNERLFNLSGTGRSDSIEVAWELGRERPVLGYGSGSFEYLWYERRPGPFVIRDAHSLYAEMLSEVGIVGLVLLTLALLVPLVALVRGRREPLAAAGLAAFVAWAAHSSLDWNWEVAGVTTSALLAAGVGLLAGERRRRGIVHDGLRLPLVATVGVLSVASVVSLVGNQALFAGRAELARQEWASAADHARRADRLLPWSYEPAFVLGDAAAGLGDRAGALDAYRSATGTDPENWVAWLRLAQVAAGEERTRAYARVHELNPKEEELPGERR
jgi:hypothetical protein